MKTIDQEDLHEVFLLIIRHAKRKHLPYVRRHYKSVANLCKANAAFHIDVYYSGVFIATKKKDSTKLVMNREYTRLYKDEFYEVAA